jgi:hypothetical protein
MIRLGFQKIIPPIATFALGIGSLLFFAFAEVWFRVAGDLYEKSLKFKAKLLASNSKIVRRKGLAFRQVTTNVAHFYKVKRGTVLTYFNILSNITMTLLLYRGRQQKENPPPQHWYLYYDMIPCSRFKL